MSTGIDDAAGCSIEADRALADLLDQISRKLQAGEPIDSDALPREHPDYAERLKSLCRPCT